MKIKKDIYGEYSPLDIAMHVLYCKYIVTKETVCDVEGEYPYAKEDFPKLETPLTSDVWNKILNCMVIIHNKYISALNEFPEEKLSEEFPVWKCKWGKILYWFPTRYTFHGTQIRNMGIKKIY